METEHKCYDFDSTWAMENKAWVHIEQFIYYTFAHLKRRFY